jgi:crotonobetainyl-CoA:carnitine CoA-transferase CaiB-like acyl-CoA transferase
MVSPIVGVTVVAFGQAVAAPYCTAAQRLGLDAKSLVRARPGLVAVDMSGYGTQWPVPLRAVPALGEHTGAILTELGLSAEEQSTLADVGAV